MNEKKLHKTPSWSELHKKAKELHSIVKKDIKEEASKKGEQGSSKQITKKMRCTIITLNNLTLPEVFTLLAGYASRAPSRSQIKIEQIKIRFSESYKPLPQVPSSSPPQRKLLRLKNSPNQRNGVERGHTKSKARKRKNRQKLLRKSSSKTPRFIATRFKNKPLKVQFYDKNWRKLKGE